MLKDEVRELFPHLKKGLIYFNHASMSPLSSRTAAVLNQLITDKSETEIDNFHHLFKIISENKIALTEMLNTSPDRIAFTDNTSNGINLLASGINWKKNDRILLNDAEFPANVYPYLNLKKKNVFIDFAKSKDGIISAQELIQSVRPGTKLIAVSFVQFLSGCRIDLEILGKYCKENGIIFAVDAIQGLGAFSLDVKKYNVDFISCGTQKWMMGIPGLGFIYVSGELQDKISQQYVGWVSVENVWDLLNYNLELKKSAERFQTGTMNIFGLYALNVSLKLFKEFGQKNVENEILMNTAYLLSELKKIGLDPLLWDYDEANLSGIVSVKINNAKKIFEDLSAKNITGTFREGHLRFSPHFYNSNEDIDTVISELKKYL
jgi:cysteine desulfurase / selenocysteine lyase